MCLAVLFFRYFFLSLCIKLKEFLIVQMKLNEYVLTSLQCGRQIAQLKDEYEEAKKTLEEETLKLRQVSLINLNKKD